MRSRNTLFSFAVPVLVVVAGSVWFLQDKPKGGAAPQGDGMQMPMEKPLPEHLQLKKSVGTWDCVVRASMSPGAPAMESKATSTDRMLGDFVLMEEFKGDLMGMPFTGIGLIGYDALDKKYWSTWVESTGSKLSVSEGKAGENPNVITLTAEAKNPMTGKPMKMRKTLETKGDDARVLTFYMAGPDGKEFPAMTIDYKRRK